MKNFIVLLAILVLAIGCKNNSTRIPASEATQGLPGFTSNSELIIHPRPSVVPDPDFSGPENNLCYNYANLLLRNGGVEGNPQWIQEAREYLNNQNNHIDGPLNRDLLTQVYAHGTIVIHHTAGGGDASDVINYHMLPQGSAGRGFSDTGYHFIIEQNGRIVTGRSLAQMGAHVKQIPNREQDCANNKYFMDLDPDYRSIGIALVGHYYHRGSPPSAQINSLRRLVQKLRERFNITEVVRHRDLKHTACPGSVGSIPGLYSPPTEETLRAREQSASPFRNPQRRLICYSCQ